MLEQPSLSRLAHDKRGYIQAVTRSREPVCDEDQSQTEEKKLRTRIGRSWPLPEQLCLSILSINRPS